MVLMEYFLKTTLNLNFLDIHLFSFSNSIEKSLLHRMLLFNLENIYALCYCGGVFFKKTLKRRNFTIIGNSVIFLKFVTKKKFVRSCNLLASTQLKSCYGVYGVYFENFSLN